MHEALKRRVTRTEFLLELGARGYPRTRRWHEDWIDAGLLDRAEPTGRAGGGVSYTWPRAQVELADALLEKNRTVSRGALPKLVVFLWLWYGDEYVPFRQVPRAMRTWAQAERAAPAKNVRAMATELVSRVAHKSGTGRRRLVRTLVEFPATGDPAAIRDAFDDVFDPDRTGRPRGPDGASINTEGYLRIIAIRQRAVANLGRYSEQQYAAAREMYRITRANYARAQPGYALDKDLGRMHPPVDTGELADSACQDLLSCLGFLYERETASERQKLRPSPHPTIERDPVGEPDAA